MDSNHSMKKFMRGALLLTIAAIIAKVLSAIYRIPFQNLVGDQGFYVFQQVYPFAAIFIVLTSSGLAVAISKMLIDEPEQAMRMKQAIFSFLVVVGSICFIILFACAPIFARMMGDEALTPLIRITSVIPLTMPFIAIFKGVYQAVNEMQRVAYAQLIEQSCRVAIILGGTMLVLFVFNETSVYIVGQVAVSGIVVGAVVSLLYLWRVDRTQMKFITLKVWDFTIVKKIVVYSLSISMSSLLVIFFQFIDAFTILNGLVASGIDKDMAMTIKGIYDRGQSLVQFSMVLVSSLAMAIVPIIAFKSKKGSRRELPYVRLTFRVTFMMSTAAAVGLALVMPYANKMLFETDALSDMLSIYVLQIIPLCFVLTFTAVLQGYGKLAWPTIFIGVAILIKLISNTFFVKTFGITGAAYANNIALVIAAICFIVYLKKWRKMKLAKPIYYVKLVASLALMSGVIYVLNMYVIHEAETRIQAMVAAGILIVAGALVFIVSATKMRVLTVREWFLLPFGKYVAALQLYLNQKK